MQNNAPTLALFAILKIFADDFLFIHRFTCAKKKKVV